MSPTVVYEGAVSSGEVGGARVHFSGMARALDERLGADVLAVTPAFAGERPLDIDLRGGGRHVCLPGLRGGAAGHLSYELVKTLYLAGRRVSDVARRRSTHVIMRVTPVGFAPLVLRALGARVTIEMNGVPDLEYTSRGATPWMVRAARWTTFLQLRSASSVVAVTEGIATVSRERTRAPVARIENGVDEHAVPFDLVSSRPGNARTIAYSGAFAPWQDLTTLVDALARLVDDEPATPWRLVLIGDGECRPDVERRVAQHRLGDRVDITGWLERDEALRRLLEARVAVVPSLPRGDERVSGSPLKLFEYLAAGRSIVGSDVDGIVELDDYPVVVYERQNAASLATAIRDAAAVVTDDLASLRRRISWADRCDRMLDFIGVR